MDTESQTSPPAEWLQPAMAVNGIGSFAWDIRRNTLEWDALATRILGVGPDELDHDPRRLLALLRGDDARLVGDRVRRAVAENGQCGAYVRVAAPDGSRRAVRFRARVVADGADGRPVRMVGFVWDAGAEQRKRSRNDQQAAARRARDAFLEDASRRLAEATTVTDVARAFTELRFPESAPNGRVVAMLDAGRFTILGVAGYREEPILGLNGTGMESPHPGVTAFQSREPVFLGSPREYRERFPEAWPYAARLGRQAWAFLPLIAEGRAIAVGMVSYDHEHGFPGDERALLTTVGGLVAQALARARLHDAEHQLATGLQQVLLPRRVPHVPGLETAVRYLPAGAGLHIGGDWYDVVPVPGGKAALIVGDVQGHDVHAAGVMGQLRVALRAYAAEGHPPDSVLARSNRFLADLDTGLFATCLYAEVDTGRGTVDVARAGHPEPIIRHGDGSTTVRAAPGGLPLGIDPGETYPVTRIDVDPGETLVLASDGLIESRAADLDEGLRRLRGVLSRPLPGEAAEAGGERSGDLAAEAPAPAGAEAAEGPSGRDGDDRAGAETAAGEWPSAAEALGAPAAGSSCVSAYSDLEQLAERLIDSAADETEREDDIALLLMRWDAEAGEAPTRTLRRTVSQADLAKIADVRADLRDACKRWGVGELADTAELLVSELVTNALVHTDGDMVLSVQLFRSGPGYRLRAEVEDDSDQWLRKRTPGEQASSGRGLLLVEQLADAWGVQPRGDGKRVWFELRSGS